MATHSNFTIARLWSKVNVSQYANDCWLWTGAVRGNYGNIKVAGKNVGAHAIAWEVFNDKPIAPYWALHLCGNKLCCNPRHIYPGTPHQNNIDQKMDAYAKRGITKPRHRKGVKMTADELREVIARRNSGERFTAISSDMGFKYNTVRSAYIRGAQGET